jgi:hypothetical protein
LDQLNASEFFKCLASSDGGRFEEMREIGGGLYAANKPLLFHWTLLIGKIGNGMTCWTAGASPTARRLSGRFVHGTALENWRDGSIIHTSA